MSFAKKPVAIALTGEQPAPRKCEDCTHYRDVKGRQVCVEEVEHNGATHFAMIDILDMRADEEGCGPDADWFEPKLVLVQ